MKFEEARENYSRFMQECIDLALIEGNRVPPPYVACVILDKSYKQISRGLRRRIEGGLLIHAERDAVNNSNSDLRGATIVTTLEPCKYKKTSQGYRDRLLFAPCTELIIKNGIAHVVYGHPDSNDCGGANILRSKGIEVFYLEQFNDQIERRLFQNPKSEIHELKRKKMDW